MRTRFKKDQDFVGMEALGVNVDLVSTGQDSEGKIKELEKLRKKGKR